MSKWHKNHEIFIKNMLINIIYNKETGNTGLYFEQVI